MQLFYAPNITLPVYTLPEDESKHAVRVLRMAVGDAMHLTDGRGAIYTSRITDANPKRCAVEIVGVETGVGQRGYSLSMAVAPTKSADRFGWFLEKATEVGVDIITPIDCRHSERRTINTARENRVITSAVKQSVRAYHPSLEEMTPFEQLVHRPFAGLKLIAHCGDSAEEKRLIPDIVTRGDNVLVLIGPEGDFSPEEVALALALGFEEISLGQARLRTETAALMAVMSVAFINR